MDRATRSMNWRTDRIQAPEASSDQHTPRQENRYREKLRRQQSKNHRRDQLSTREPANSSRVYVGNLSYTAQKKDIENLFADAGLNITNIDISIDRFTNRNPSYCFVDLATPEAATDALDKLPGIMLLGRPVKVKPCVQKHSESKDVTQLQATRWSFTNGPNDNPRGNDLLLPLRERRRVIVSGLPKPIDQATSDAELRELFDGFEVEAISKVKWPQEVKHDANMNVRFAFIDFRSAEEAKTAVHRLNGMQRWGGTIQVAVVRRNPSNMFERVVQASAENMQEDKL